jgi:hypothetical protein
MKAHVIENGKVTNTISVEALDFMPNLISADNGGSIGDTWDGVSFTTPSVVIQVPEKVTMAQARRALITSGISIASIDAAIASITDQMQRELAHSDWNFEQYVRRDSGLIALLASGLGLDGNALDSLFILAKTL